ncbi:MerR family transcriptional regulator [Ottowia pentelensis]|uniref:MerR family transcriptional regulator n=1 Tax=Ottowia pentelensis TaxID=511108 RepID=A0ABV6PPV8_9BURK
MQPILPPIPAKRYFTIGEVGELCAVKPHVLRYWEQEFTQLRPMKRQGNRRYYQHHEVLMIRRIRELLYEQGFSIHGARLKLAQGPQHGHSLELADDGAGSAASGEGVEARHEGHGPTTLSASADCLAAVAAELREIRRLLTVDF